ncbi:MAG TPA: ABC transporter permease [Tepidisphaeraceae bacterium]|jgi:peptide/nickel transport system permease protein
MVDDMALAPADAPVQADAPPTRGLVAQAIRDTLSGAGAKAGLVWICVVGFCAVFAPFLANSYPLAVKIGGHWSSPLLRHLTPVDVILLVMFFACVILALIRRLTFARKLAIGGIVLVVITPLAYLFVRPPSLDVFEEYRDLAKQGKIEAAIYAPIPYSANDRMRDQPEDRLSPPNRRHLLGTEDTGGDLLSRMIHACRIAMSIGFISTGIAVVIGIVVGGVMGYFVGAIDLFGMRLIEIFEAIPTLFLLIAIVAFFGRNLYIMMAIIGLTTWTGDARFIRGEFLRLRNQDFVHAAVAAGLPVRSVLFRHILPNGISPLIVSASFGIASAILYESTLSFLGLGLVDEPSWGQMLEQSLGVGGTFIWWIAFFPGLAIFLTVFAYNLIGESLRDALDPRLHGIE